jgi:tRNA (uracil-5-)-methyltransferase
MRVWRQFDLTTPVGRCLQIISFIIIGRAEFELPEMLKKFEKEKTVAIVDPPRAGLHSKAIFALRASNVDTLVYVSCDAKAAMNNFIDLGRMTSNTYKGEPFVPRKVIPVDLFPHANHFELVILFERFPLKKALALE